MKNIIVVILLFSCFNSIGQMTWEYNKTELSVDLHVDSMSLSSGGYKGRRVILRSPLLEFTQQIILLENITFESFHSDGALELVDVNFDGYLDVKLVFGLTYSYRSYQFYVYNPSVQRFEKDNSSHEYFNISFDTVSKTIHHFWRVGTYTFGHGLLAWKRGELVEIANEIVYFNPIDDNDLTSYVELNWIEEEESKKLIYDQGLFLEKFYPFNSDRLRLDRLVNIKETITESERKKLRDSIILNIESLNDEYCITRDTLLDVNYDGELDFIVKTYGKQGSVKETGMLVYPFSKTDNNYIYSSDLSKIKNPEIDLENKTIVGYSLSESGGTGERYLFENGNFGLLLKVLKLRIT